MICCEIESKKSKGCKMLKTAGKSQSGSVLLLLILAMSVLSLFCLAAWHSSMLFHDMSLARLFYEQKFRAAQGGLKYGIHICAKQFNQLCSLCSQENKDFFIELSPFKISENTVYTCKIDIAGDTPDSLALKSTLFGQSDASGVKKKLFELSCTLTKSTEQLTEKKKEKLVIRNWNIGDLA